MDDFNDDLRSIMRRVGVEGERVCFIFDESNVLSSGFIEAINALLASGEIPGLFDGEDYTALVVATRDSAVRRRVLGRGRQASFFTRGALGPVRA